MAGASDRRSVSAGHFRSNDLLEARESARAGNKLLEFTQLGIAGARSAPATMPLTRECKRVGLSGLLGYSSPPAFVSDIDVTSA